MALLAGFLSAAFYAPAYDTFVDANKKDFAVVSREASLLRDGERLGATHFVAPDSVALILRLAPSLSPLRATWLFMLLTQAATAALVFALLRPLIEASQRTADLLALLGCLAMQLVAPIALLTLPAKTLYAGYFNPHNFHNPSSHLLEPMALLLFFSFAALWQRRDRAQGIALIVCIASLHVVSLLTKPSFSLVFVPALLGLSVLSAAARWGRVDWRLVLGAGVLPFVAVASWQFLGTFSVEAFAAQPRGIEIRPLAIALEMTTPAMLPINLLASVAFPLAVVGAVLARRRVSAELFLAWVGYFGAALLALLLVEGVVEIVDGERVLQKWRAGNFWWSVQISGFLLFVASLRELLVHWRELALGTRVACLGLLALHASFGALRWFLHAGGSIWNGWS